MARSGRLLLLFGGLLLGLVAIIVIIYNFFGGGGVKIFAVNGKDSPVEVAGSSIIVNIDATKAQDPINATAMPYYKVVFHSDPTVIDYENVRFDSPPTLAGVGWVVSLSNRKNDNADDSKKTRVPDAVRICSTPTCDYSAAASENTIYIKLGDGDEFLYDASKPHEHHFHDDGNCSGHQETRACDFLRDVTVTTKTLPLTAASVTKSVQGDCRKSANGKQPDGHCGLAFGPGTPH